MKVDIKALGQYDGQTTDRKGNVILKVKFSYDERESLAKMLILPGQTIQVFAKYNKNKAVKLGEFGYKNLII